MNAPHSSRRHMKTWTSQYSRQKMRSCFYFVLRKLRHWILIVNIDPVWFGANKQFNRNNEFTNRQTNRVLLHSTQSSSNLTHNKSNQLFFLKSIDLFSLRLLSFRKMIFFFCYIMEPNKSLNSVIDHAHGFIAATFQLERKKVDFN